MSSVQSRRACFFHPAKRPGQRPLLLPGGWPGRNATQHISRECRKCFRPPRTSQMPFIGWIPVLCQPLQCTSFIASPSPHERMALPYFVRKINRVEHLAINIELQLVVRRIADPHRLANRDVPAQMRQLYLPALPGCPSSAVQHLQRSRALSLNSNRSFSQSTKLLCFFSKAQPHERIQREMRSRAATCSDNPSSGRRQSLPATQTSAPQSAIPLSGWSCSFKTRRRAIHHLAPAALVSRLARSHSRQNVDSRRFIAGLRFIRMQPVSGMVQCLVCIMRTKQKISCFSGL